MHPVSSPPPLPVLAACRHPALPEAAALVRRQPASLLRRQLSVRWLLKYGDAHTKLLLQVG